MFNCVRGELPPLYDTRNSYLTSEPYRHTAAGRGVYFGAISWGKKYYGFHSTAAQFVAGYHKKALFEQAKKRTQEELFVLQLGDLV